MLTRGGGGGHEYDNMNIPPKFLQIKQEDKFFSRLLSKEKSSTKGEASFRVLYYGGAAGAIPFTWESRPGTPKHTFSDTFSPPPLTPPPSYQMSPRTIKKKSKPKFLHSINLLRMAGKKNNSGTDSSAESFSSLSFSSSYSLPSTTMNMNSFTSRRKCVRRSRSAVHFGPDFEDEDAQMAISSPNSTLCFGGGGSRSSAGKFRSYYRMKNVKKALLSIVGHGAAQKWI